MSDDRFDRFERLANLVTFLLDTAHGVTYAEIVEAIDGYPAGAEARRRAFERDKKLLRDEDIPLVEDNGRYRIPPEEYYLPDLGLTEEEQVALQLAVASVPVGAGEGGAALQKLTLGAGVGAAAAGSAVAGVTELDDHPLLPPLHAAIRRRATVTFSHSGSTRTVEPSMLFFREGYWYLHGFDRLRQDVRNYRVDRIEGDVAVGPPDEVPPGRRAAADPAAAMPREPWLMGQEAAEVAAVRVDAVLAAKAVADAGPSAEVERHPDGSVLIRVPVVRRDIFRSRWVLGMLDHAVVEAPPDLRDSVIDWLRAIADGAG